MNETWCFVSSSLHPVLFSFLVFVSHVFFFIFSFLLADRTFFAGVFFSFSDSVIYLTQRIFSLPASTTILGQYGTVSEPRT
ncbi:hypothetical protein QVD17_01258 [Tagetes erecta]|uniref:Uncharacterized protein n=1 Tax=Tagetes erecta TaxID=13708 RepID=A0AAD8L4M7_TARER|nr:hypothetical protein QVD17_01258 [Tagetes erecta]